MTFAPPTILEVRRFLKGEDPDLSDVELGIVGGRMHVATGTSYHLGKDQLNMSRNPYSARTPRDKAGLSNAASALDIDDDLDELRELSLWLVGQCMQLAPDTLDIREIIYSPDGFLVLRWDRERGGGPVPDPDTSHRTHTHVSWYRDSEFRSKVGLFARFYLERLGMNEQDAQYLIYRVEALAHMFKTFSGGPEAGNPVPMVLALETLMADVRALKDRQAIEENVIRRIVREEIDVTKLGRQV